MNFKYITKITDEIIFQYKELTNKVIKKTHAIGFIHGLTNESAKEFLNKCINKKKSALLLVHQNDNLIATGFLTDSGYLSTQHYAIITKVMIDPDLQAKGTGKKIMNELENKAKELNYTHILVRTWDIDYILRFYIKCGYKEVGVIPDFVKYKNQIYDSHNFIKKLK